MTTNANKIDNWLRDGLDEFTVPAIDPRRLVADSTPAPRRHRRRLAGLGLAAAAAAAAIVLAIALAPSGEPVGPPAVQASVRLTLPGTVLDSAGEGSVLWVLTCEGTCGDPTAANGGHGDLVKVDNETGAIEETVPVKDPHSLAVGEGAVWVVQTLDDRVSRYSPESGELVATVPLSLPAPVSEGPEGFRFLPFTAAVGGGSLWVGTDRGYVAEVDLRSNEVVRTVKTSAPADDLAVAGGSVAVAANLDGVLRIDAATGAVSGPEPIEDGSGRRLSVSELFTAEGSFWAEGGWSEAATGSGYVATDERGVVEFDPASGRIENVSTVPASLSVRAVDGPRLWLADAPSRKVYELDGPGTEAKLVARLKSSGTIIGSVGTALWVGEAHGVIAQFKLPRAG